MKRLRNHLILGAIAIVFGGAVVLAIALVSLQTARTVILPEPQLAFWSVRAIDTMKYSRDVARGEGRAPSFDAVIRQQVGNIAATGATHVAVATPYDEEFLPFMKRWLAVARANGLKVWFRGNWSGWEGWFDYPKIGRAEHVAKTRQFILAHPDIFEDGDIFTACPECENGGPGDPRFNGDLAGHRKFLIDEHRAMEEAFTAIGKQVNVNYNSMNGDVAWLVMDKETTQALGGVVAIDHYVPTVDELVDYIRRIGERSGGKVVLGEIGAPVPDIHGSFSSERQAAWVEELMTKLARVPNVIGLNYWTSVGGSTQLWLPNGTPRSAVRTLTDFYDSHVVFGAVRDELGRPIVGAIVSDGFVSAETDWRGYFELLDREREQFAVAASADGYQTKTLQTAPSNEEVIIVLSREEEDAWFRFLKFLKEHFLTDGT
jgi:hypothetical protein